MPRKEKETHHDPHGKPPRGEKPRRRRRGFPVVLTLLLLLAIIIAVLVIFKPFGGSGFGLGGLGNNVSSGDSENSRDNSASSIPESDSSESNIAVIRIDGNDIFLDGEQCESAADLKDKITALGTKKDYELDHSAAIKSAYDEVKQVLTELENALDISVNYNE